MHTLWPLTSVPPTARMTSTAVSSWSGKNGVDIITRYYACNNRLPEARRFISLAKGYEGSDIAC